MSERTRIDLVALMSVVTMLWIDLEHRVGKKKNPYLYEQSMFFKDSSMKKKSMDQHRIYACLIEGMLIHCVDFTAKS